MRKPKSRHTPKGESLRFYREVALLHEADECLFWPYGKDQDGYGRLNHGGWRQIVSRMVCRETYGTPPPGYEAAHSCDNGNLGCVAKRHLSWKTHAENVADMWARGRRPRKIAVSF